MPIGIAWMISVSRWSAWATMYARVSVAPMPQRQPQRHGQERSRLGEPFTPTIAALRLSSNHCAYAASCRASCGAAAAKSSCILSTQDSHQVRWIGRLAWQATRHRSPRAP